LSLDRNRGLEGNLECYGVTVRFASGFTLGPLDLSLSKGLHHLRGENGSGKTTLLRCLCGDLRPTDGQVRVCGRDPIREPRARKHIALLPAVPDLPSFLRAGEAWRLLAALRGSPRWSGEVLLARLGVDPDLRLGDASSGPRRRAELVAVLAGEPEILLLDEVFTNLDESSTRLLVEILDELRASRVMLLTGHGNLPLLPDGELRLGAGRALGHGG
jgi:ABC-2 type transport system ATP-binding protein